MVFGSATDLPSLTALDAAGYTRNYPACLAVLLLSCYTSSNHDGGTAGLSTRYGSWSSGNGWPRSSYGRNATSRRPYGWPSSRHDARHASWCIWTTSDSRPHGHWYASRTRYTCTRSHAWELRGNGTLGSSAAHVPAAGSADELCADEPRRAATIPT